MARTLPRGGMADEMRRALSDIRRQLDKCWKLVQKYPTSLPAEHIPYIENKIRKLAEYLFKIADELEAKQKGD